MSTSTFAVFSSIFGLIVSVVSLFAFLINICRPHLPSNKIKELESLMDETETFFNEAVEDGLLIEPGFVRQTGRRLQILRTITCGLQSRAYNATTLRQDCLELLRGTSKSIRGTCQSLKRLKAQIITSSEKGRSSSRLERNSGTHPLPSSALPLTFHSERHPTPLSFVRTRPRSCPPVLSGFRSDDAQCVYPRGSANPFRDPPQSDLDVGTTDAQISVSIAHTSVTLEPGA